MDDLGNAVVVVVIFCDVVSSLLHFFVGIFHSTADMGGPDHGNIIFGISGSNGVTQWDSSVFTEKTNGRALVNTGSDVLQVFIAGEETVDLAICKVSGLFKIITEMLLVFIIYNQHFDWFRFQESCHIRNDLYGILTMEE